MWVVRRAGGRPLTLDCSGEQLAQESQRPPSAPSTPQAWHTGADVGIPNHRQLCSAGASCAENTRGPLPHALNPALPRQDALNRQHAFPPSPTTCCTRPFALRANPLLPNTPTQPNYLTSPAHILACIPTIRNRARKAAGWQSCGPLTAPPPAPVPPLPLQSSRVCV